jgi:hypothetical protein
MIYHVDVFVDNDMPLVDPQNPCSYGVFFPSCNICMHHVLLKMQLKTIIESTHNLLRSINLCPLSLFKGHAVKHLFHLHILISNTQENFYETHNFYQIHNLKMTCSYKSKVKIT